MGGKGPVSGSPGCLGSVARRLRGAASPVRVQLDITWAVDVSSAGRVDVPRRVGQSWARGRRAAARASGVRHSPGRCLPGRKPRMGRQPGAGEARQHSRRALDSSHRQQWPGNRRCSVPAGQRLRVRPSGGAMQRWPGRRTRAWYPSRPASRAFGQAFDQWSRGERARGVRDASGTVRVGLEAARGSGGRWATGQRFDQWSSAVDRGWTVQQRWRGWDQEGRTSR